MLFPAKAGAKLSAFLPQCKLKMNVITFSTGCGCLKQTIAIAFENLPKRDVSYYLFPPQKKAE